MPSLNQSAPQIIRRRLADASVATDRRCPPALRPGIEQLNTMGSASARRRPIHPANIASRATFGIVQYFRNTPPSF
jgi:hypothetical protein